MYDMNFLVSMPLSDSRPLEIYWTHECLWLVLHIHYYMQFHVHVGL